MNTNIALSISNFRIVLGNNKLTILESNDELLVIDLIKVKHYLSKAKGYISSCLSQNSLSKVNTK